MIQVWFILFSHNNIWSFSAILFWIKMPSHPPSILVVVHLQGKPNMMKIMEIPLDHQNNFCQYITTHINKENIESTSIFAMNSCLLPPLLLQKNSNKWIIYDMNSSFSSRTLSSISRFSSMDLNHKPFEQLYLASFGQIFTIKTKLSKFSIPSQHYLKTNGDTLSSLQKIMYFLLGKLIEKVTFCTFDNLTKELLWKVDLNMLVLTSRQDGHVSNWLLVFFTNTLNYILISQFIQLLIWLIIKMIVNMYGF